MSESLTAVSRNCRALLAVMTLCWCFSARPVDGYSEYTRNWAVEIRGGREAADKLAKEHGFTNMGEVGNLQDMYRFSLDSPGSLWGTDNGGKRNARDIHTFQSHGDQLRTIALQRESNVGYVKQQRLLELQKKSSYTLPQDPQWPAQWSLRNDGQTSGPAELDLNVEPVWMQGFIGRGVVVTVVDDGVEVSHPDLQINFDVQASRDFIDHDSDPTPTGSDSHGTACAGVIGMARNGVCGVGVAPGTSLGGLRLDLGYTFDVSQAGILSYEDSYVDIYSNSWGPAETGFTVGGPGYLTLETFKRETKQGRNSKGSIYVFASGNGGRYHDSCAADGYVNSIYTIAVGSADQDGRQAYYDEDCSAKMAVTFSHNSNTAASPDNARKASKQLLTTSLHGQCSDSFSGTSASAPLLSGVIALALEANPDLTWRDVQYLIVYTSNIDILTVDDLATNGAGLKFSHHFGFGAIDAEALVTRARHWTSVPQQLNFTIPATQFECMISNGSTCELEFQFTSELGANISSLEHVLVSLSLSIVPTANDSLWNLTDYYEAEKDREAGDWLQSPHPRRGDVEIELTSPAGTRSILLPNRDYDFVNTEGYDNWPFMSVHFWGEDPTGTWTLRTTFRASSGSVFITNVTLTGFGIAEGVSGNSNRGLCQNCLRGCGDVCDVCSELRLNYSLACLSTCPNATIEYNGYCIAGSVIYPETPTGNSADGTTTVILVSVAAVVVVTLFVVVLVVLVVVLVTRKRRKDRFSTTTTATNVYWSLPDIDDNDDETVQI